MYQNKEYVLDEEHPKIIEESSNDDIVSYNKDYAESTNVSYHMIVTISSELQKGFKKQGAYNLNYQLKEMFHD